MSYGNIDMLNFLIDLGVNINLDVGSGTPLLRSMCSYNSITAIKLIQSGADLTKMDSRNSTALHIAVERGLSEVVKILLNNKSININALNSSGQRPIDFAKSEDIEMLLAIKGSIKK